MAVFSTNQSKQLYVASTNVSSVEELKNPTEIVGVKTHDDKGFYFMHYGAAGITRSDYIAYDNVIDFKVVSGEDDSQKRELGAYNIVLNPEVNGGNPVAGQDYIVKVMIRQFVSNSDESTYNKFGAVHAYSGMSAETFYTVLADSLVKNFKRELVKYIKVMVAGKEVAGSKKVNGVLTLVDSTGATITTNDEGITLVEVEQDWVLGTKSLVPVYFEVAPSTVTYEGDELIWGVVTKKHSKEFVYNAKNIADLEYFLMGERGDQYRMVGWPDHVPTKYLVTGTDNKNTKYSILTIRYYYTNEIQRSEKEIVVVSQTLDTLNTLATNVGLVEGE